MSEASGEAKDKQDEKVGLEGSISDEKTEGMCFGSFETAKQFIEEMKMEYSGGSYSSAEAPQKIDGQIVTDSDNKQEDSEDVHASDVVAVIDKIKEAEPEIGNKSLDVKDVEVEYEQVGSENLYVNGDHFGESIEGDAVEAEVTSQSSVRTGSITSSDQMSEARGEAKDKKDEEAGLEGLSDGNIDGMCFGSFETAK
ncbi:hypothetical protein K7X08_004883 [Anisodus acutangulus]|uniref:Uncharacterized protein n=1 Tax=Anisodus acutangulus TaxID=402998 RepID=A0A9Q1RI91_9SOLA|nr:hypothetical protein K7X08_004883 [Anisodus acutangulus]